MTKEQLVKALEEGDYKNLANAADEYKNDAEIIKAAIINGKWSAIEYAGDQIKSNRNLILEFLELDVENIGLILEYLPDTYRDDKEMILAALKGISPNLVGGPLELASDSLKNDKEVVLQAVILNGSHLEHASSKLKNDRDVVQAALESNAWSIEFAGPEMKNDKSIMLEAIKNDSYSIKYASDDLKNDEDIILAVADDDADLALEFVGENLKKNKEFMEKLESM